MHSQKQKTEHLILVPEVLALPRQKVREPRRRVSVHGWNFAALFLLRMFSKLGSLLVTVRYHFGDPGRHPSLGNYPCLSFRMRVLGVRGFRVCGSIRVYDG